MIRIYQCQKCFSKKVITYHSNLYCCPVCEASYYYQDNPYSDELDDYIVGNFFKPNHPIAIEFRKQEKLRKFNQLTKNQSTSMLKEMLNILVDRIDSAGMNPNNDKNEFKIEELDTMIHKLIRVRGKMVSKIEKNKPSNISIEENF